MSAIYSGVKQGADKHSAPASMSRTAHAKQVHTATASGRRLLRSKEAVRGAMVRAEARYTATFPRPGLTASGFTVNFAPKL